MSHPEALLPLGEAFSPTELERTFRVERIEPAQSPAFAFRLRVPREWGSEHAEQMDRPVEAGEYTPLAGYMAPTREEVPPTFVVEAMQLTREIAAKNLLLLRAGDHFMEVCALRELHPVLGEGYFLQRTEGQRYAVRMALQIEGDRAFVLTGLSRPEQYAEVADVFGAMIESFAIERPSGKRSIEEWDDFSVLGEVTFSHPRSWAAALLPGSKDARAMVSITSRDEEGALVGVMYVEVERGEPLSIDEEYLRIASLCAEAQVSPDGMPRTLKLSVSSPRFRGIGSRSWTAMVADTDVEHEVHMTVVATPTAVVRAWLTTPSMRGHIHNWALNQRAWEIVLGTMR